jgi:hypothetical protein
MQRTSYRNTLLFAAIILLLFATLAFPSIAFAGGLTESKCTDDGGSYTDYAGYNTCLFHAGTEGFADYGAGCTSNVLVFIDELLDEVTDAACDVSVAPPNRLHCARIDLPRAILQQAAHPISFKAPMNISSAALRLSGFDIDVPINNLSYDSAARTWSGDFNAYLIPAGEYGNVRVIISGNHDDSKACNIGRLTVEG